MSTLLTAATDAACDCPHCGQTLRVNLAFAGRLARCRCCDRPFKVPPRRDLIDSTASFLIEQDVAEEFERRARRSETV